MLMKQKILHTGLAPIQINDYTDGQESSLMVDIPRSYLNDIVSIVKEFRVDNRRIKGSWTRREDTILRDLVQEYGARKWKRIAMHLRGRVGKQCRERWMNHLDPRLDHTEFRPDEDLLIMKLHSQYGNQWSKISRFLKGRTANKVKNRWNSCLSKRDDDFDSVFPNDTENIVMMTESENLIAQVEQMDTRSENAVPDEDGNKGQGNNDGKVGNVNTPNNRKMLMYNTRIGNGQDVGYGNDGFSFLARQHNRPFPFTFTSAPQQAVYNANLQDFKSQSFISNPGLIDEGEDEEDDIRDEEDEEEDEEEDDETQIGMMDEEHGRKNNENQNVGMDKSDE